jgi:hypothetical protein
MRTLKVWSWLLFLLISPRIFALSPSQQEELYRYGSISSYDAQGNKTGHFEVKFMPGSENIGTQGKENLRLAYARFATLVDVEQFWRLRVGREFQRGLRLMKDSVSEVSTGLPQKFRDTRRENALVEGEFGARAAQGRNWLLFGGKVVGTTLRSLCGVMFGGVYSVVAPSLMVAWQPIAGVSEAALAGMALPSLKYVWNGVAWQLTKDSNEPKLDSITVTFVPR